MTKKADQMRMKKRRRRRRKKKKRRWRIVGNKERGFHTGHF
jgi:hypothetical protein